MLVKFVSVMMSLILGVYGLLGLTDGVSEDFEEGKYKNVILMIGDGMSFSHVAATEKYLEVDLVMNDMPVTLQSEISSFLLPATDSAAGGTALATGMKVWMNSVGIFPFDPFTIDDLNVPVNLCELVKADGLAAGVVTTDKTSGATPSSFSAHALDRGMEENISQDQLTSSLDLIWGGNSSSVNEKNAAENGWCYIDDKDEMNALEAGSRSFAQFSYDDLRNCTSEYNTPSIKEMTEKAIELLDANERGFFLMVEGACIDKFSHDKEMEGALLCTEEFDKAVAAALDFAREDGETLVVVTADHGTGGLVLREETGEYVFTSTSHDLTDVPVYVSAEDAGFVSGMKISNCDIANQIARVMGYGEDRFPASSVSLG